MYYQQGPVKTVLFRIAYCGIMQKYKILRFCPQQPGGGSSSTIRTGRSLMLSGVDLCYNSLDSVWMRAPNGLLPVVRPAGSDADAAYRIGRPKPRNRPI